MRISCRTYTPPPRTSYHNRLHRKTQQVVDNNSARSKETLVGWQFNTTSPQSDNLAGSLRIVGAARSKLKRISALVFGSVILYIYIYVPYIYRFWKKSRYICTCQWDFGTYVTHLRRIMWYGIWVDSDHEICVKIGSTIDTVWKFSAARPEVLSKLTKKTFWYCKVNKRSLNHDPNWLLRARIDFPCAILAIFQKNRDTYIKNIQRITLLCAWNIPNFFTLGSAQR